MKFNTDNLYPVDRVVNTVYYNNNSFPIFLNIGIDETGTGTDTYHYQLDINNVSIATYEHELANNEHILLNFNFIIPANVSYEIVKTGGIGDLYSWYEYNLPETTFSINGNSLKSIIIKDDINIDYLTDYNYSVFINNVYWKDVSKDEILLIPDDVDILIYVPSPIKTEFSQAYSMSKTSLMILGGILISFSIIIAIAILLFNRIRGKK